MRILYRILLLTIILSSSIINAQVPVNTWVKTIGGSGIDEVYTGKVDGDYNYIAGKFTGVVDFDPGQDTIELSGTNDAFLAKYNIRGEYQWAFSLNGTSTEKIVSITTDASHNIYVAGVYAGTVNFNPLGASEQLTSAGNYSSFFAKYDSDGNLLFVKNIISDVEVTVKGISIDAVNNIYIAGSYKGLTDFDPSAAIASRSAGSNANIFASKYNSTGDYQWIISIGDENAYSDEASAIKADAAGNIYLTGYFIDYIDFDPGAGENKLFPGRGSAPFMAKYNTNGIHQYAVSLTANSSSFGSSIDVDAYGNAYVIGQFYGNMDLDPGAGTIMVEGYGNLFFCKLNPTGALVWGKAILGSSIYLVPYSVHVDSNNDVYIAGQCLFNGTNVSVDFSPPPSAPASGSIVTSSSYYSGFVAKYANSGNFSWVGFLFGGNSSIYNVSTNNSKELYLTGNISGMIDYNLTSGTDYKMSDYNYDFFLARYCSTNNPFHNTTTEAAVNICSEGSTSLTTTGEGPMVWSKTKNGSSLGTGNTFITPSLSAPDTFYVKDNSLCGAGISTMIPVRVNYIEDDTIVSWTTAICNAGTGKAMIEVPDSRTDSYYTLVDLTNDTICEGPRIGTGSGTGFYLYSDNLLSTSTFGVKEGKKILYPLAGKCIEFDGVDDYITGETPLYETDNMTVELWVKYKRITPGANKSIIYIGNPSSNGYGLTLVNSKINLQCKNFYFPIIDMPVNEWTHLALVRNAGKWEFYMNGKKINWSANYNVIYIGDTNPLKIGGVAGDYKYFDGYIDDVRFWNVVRTANEIKDNMITCMDGPYTYGLYDFETGNGTTLEDRAWQHINLTLMNMDPSTAWVTGFGCYLCERLLSYTPTVNIGTQTNQSITLCTGDSIEVASKFYKLSGIYHDTLTSIYGCDSIVVTTINKNDLTISLTGTVLHANENGASYQWIDCDNSNTPLINEITQDLTVTASGNYAAIITKNECTDTSACSPVTVNVSGTISKKQSHFSIYPNPVIDQLTLNYTSYKSTSLTIRLVSPEGQVLYNDSLSIVKGIYKNNIDMKAYNSGIYLLQIISDEEVINTKVFKTF